MPADAGGDQERPPVSSTRAGAGSACPRCGVGPLYDGWLLTLRKSCPHCGLDYAKLAADDAAAFFVIVGLSAIVMPMSVAVEMIFLPPVWVHMLLWPPVLLVGAVAMLRPIKAWFIAQQYRHLLTAPDDPTE